MSPDEKEDALVGITPKGVCVGGLQERSYETFFPYASIAVWGHSSSSLSLYLSTKPTQIKYYFLIQHADEAFDLIQHYMSRL